MYVILYMCTPGNVYHTQCNHCYITLVLTRCKAYLLQCLAVLTVKQYSLKCTIPTSVAALCITCTANKHCTIVYVLPVLVWSEALSQSKEGVWKEATTPTYCKSPSVPEGLSAKPQGKLLGGIGKCRPPLN